MTNDFVVLRLRRSDVGQILDGLEARRASWAATAEVIESGYNPDDIMIEECYDEDEALAIAAHYTEIIDIISEQMKG